LLAHRNSADYRIVVLVSLSLLELSPALLHVADLGNTVRVATVEDAQRASCDAVPVLVGAHDLVRRRAVRTLIRPVLFAAEDFGLFLGHERHSVFEVLLFGLFRALNDVLGLLQGVLLAEHTLILLKAPGVQF
jgi:hypothetical protein